MVIAIVLDTRCCGRNGVLRAHLYVITWYLVTTQPNKTYDPPCCKKASPTWEVRENRPFLPENLYSENIEQGLGKTTQHKTKQNKAQGLFPLAFRNRPAPETPGTLENPVRRYETNCRLSNLALRNLPWAVDRDCWTHHS